MSTESYGKPLLIEKSGEAELLQKIPLSESSQSYDEAFIQKLVFRHPECIPIEQIDQGYADLVPICCELNTPAGPLDILFATPTGKLCIVEAKLWRNPEARRKVVGQILDYAKELSRWDYEDLQRQVSIATKQKGNAIFDLVRARHPSTEESRFVDGVSKSLSRGEFLLLILGDGIREGVGGIAEFVGGSGNLDFTFGLVELGMYRRTSGELMVVPRVLAKTVVIER